MSCRHVLSIATVLGLTLVPMATSAQKAPGVFSDMRARAIGPGGMGGRLTAVDVSLRDRNVIHVGGATSSGTIGSRSVDHSSAPATLRSLPCHPWDAPGGSGSFTGILRRGTRDHAP
jgi:hypothetical protein